MLIREKMLSKYGAVRQKYQPSEIIFKEGEEPLYYFQLDVGLVKLNHYSEGREIIKSIILPGQSICDFITFTDKNFPINAVSITETTVIKIPKHNFEKLVKEHSDIGPNIQHYVAERMFNNTIWSKYISSHSAEERVLGILKYFKIINGNPTKYSSELLYTRSQLASMTGLRIETVIRAIKRLEQKQILQIRSRKVFY